MSGNYYGQLWIQEGDCGVRFTGSGPHAQRRRNHVTQVTTTRTGHNAHPEENLRLCGGVTPKRW